MEIDSEDRLCPFSGLKPYEDAKMPGVIELVNVGV